MAHRQKEWHQWRLRQRYTAEVRKRKKLEGKSSIGTINTGQSRILDIYFKEMGKFPIIESKEEFDRLGVALQDGSKMAARNELVERTLRYAVSVAHQYCGRGVPFIDLIQQANVGLLVAAERFDPSRGFYFLTYADWWVRSEVLNDIRIYGRNVRITRAGYWWTIKRALERLSEENEQEPTPENVAEVLHLPVKTVRRALYYMRAERKSEISLTGTVSPDEDDKRTVQSIAVDRSFLTPEQYLEAKEELQLACDSLRRFFGWIAFSSEPEMHDILCLRYGLDGTWEKKTFENVADRYDLTREAVRIRIVNFWKWLRNKKKTKKDEVWLETQIARAENLQDLVGEEKPLNLLPDYKQKEK